ncbi:LysR family transcriptional regulator [Saccharopolyspora mangrovi]|uniref:LysR family transcriptional regulator n=1 Tax=Saccharopolyspora mangrovi TaxID=3082379 RepID=A0ABU6AI74_9PSEU|nr:LysR family transcriptional regulator [Saccharopolyspora sp. S2-29]MEB3371274.1 LysR family transcriptional regulator [Saccharopolyspora sp. S2-29]
MELRQLQYFLVVAEELNFSRAADRLNMTQPPLSAQVRQLEDELAVTLFERSTRKVTLTPAGEVFQRSTKRLLSELDSNVVEAQRVAKGEIGQLSLGFVPSATAEILPPILREFRKRFPDVRLVLHELTPELQVRGLREGSLDCACFYLPFNDSPPFGDRNLESAPISREPLVAALPVDHPLTAQRKIAMESLAEEPFVAVVGHSGQGLREVILEQCRRADFKPHIVQEAALIGTIAGLVASGVGVSLLPASVRRLQRMGVSYRPLQDDPIHVKMGLIWAREWFRPTLEGFINVAEEIHANSTRRGRS